MENIKSATQPKAFGRKKPEVVKMTLISLPQTKSYLEHRKTSERSKQLKKVQIIFNNGNCIIDAVLRNISENGARIEVQHPQEIPDEFTLKFTSDYTTKSCQIAWRDNKSIGLRLVSP